MRGNRISPIFQVSDFAKALDFYINVLGFKEEFVFGSYAGVSLHAAEIHLSYNEERKDFIGSGNAYVFCDEVDSYYTDLEKKGITITSKLGNQAYGLKDFQIMDVDGNLIGFGCESEES